MSRHLRAAAVLLAAVLIAAAVLVASNGPGSALPPPATGGLAALDPLLAKLATNRRVLVIGAHPDDENTELLALVSRKLGGEAGYLSLSRGEGGQNLIGEELGIGLGLIRSQELQSARRLDGARQFFTRAYDFGFTRSLPESLSNWPKEVLLEDAVRIVRRFRPQVLYSVFTGTEADGHGQHQAAGVVAREVFRLAADPTAFPALAKENLAPWKATSLFRSDWFDQANAIVLRTGDVEPLAGKSYHQIAMASRSLHRSQDMGRLQEPGPSETGAIWVDGAQGPGTKELFGGVETRLRGIASTLTNAAARAMAEGLLDRVESRAVDTRRRLSPESFADVAISLEAILDDLRAVRSVASGDPGAAALVDEKVAVAESALATAARVTVDAVAEVETAAPGESIPVSVSVWNAGPTPVTVESVELESPDGWDAARGEAAAGVVAPGALGQWKRSASIPPGAKPTVPYFLEKPLQGSVYDWTGVRSEVRGEPFQPPALLAAAVLRIGKTPVRLAREVTFRIRDEAVGEIRHSVRAVPAIEVSVEPRMIVWPKSDATGRLVEATLASNLSHPARGKVIVELPAGWPPAPASDFVLEKKGDHAVVSIPLPRPPAGASGRFLVGVAALQGGERFATSIRLVDYEHIRPSAFPRPGAASLMALELALPPSRRVGYVRGASDRVPEALEAVGIPIRILGAAELEHADLSAYDAIVVGSRAYETDAALRASNGRLLDYVRAGGLLIVQYQQYPFVQGNFAPAKLEIARPHDRITDEKSPVKVLEPGHPIFTTPNRLGPEDWDGWVQERGLYFAHSWDLSYKPLLELADPGLTPQRGGLLVAGVGKGHYVYTGLAFFRQLPAGVPGPYRLFANLLAWRASRAGSR